MKKKTTKNIIIVIMMAISMLISTISAEAAVSWPSISSSRLIKVYTISTGNNTTVYTNSNLNIKIGTIYASDELWISYIGKNSKGQWYCRLTYPVSKTGKRKEGYLPLSAVTKATSPSEKYTSGATFDSYRRASSSLKYGAVYKGDTVYKLATSGSYTQVLYNIGSASNPSGWKMAWVLTSNFNKYVDSSQTSSSTSKTYYVTTKAGLILRSSASTSSTKLCTMPYGTAIQVSSISNGWAKCSYSGKNGYCNTSYISTTKPVDKTIQVFSQKDSRWSNVSYGKGPGGSSATIGSAGCGILSYVNAVYYMNGNFIPPADLAKWSVSQGYRVNGVGTSYDLYSAYASSYGSKYGFRYAGTASSISATRTHLQNGGVAIIGVPSHIMALVDYKDGKYLILDSYSSSNRGTYSTGYRWLTASEFTGKLAVSNIRLLSKR